MIAKEVSTSKLIAAYRHFGSLRPAARSCGISKDLARKILMAQGVEKPKAFFPKKPSYNPKRRYSDFAKWHKDHASDPNLPFSLKEIASLAGVSENVARCYFYRRRKQARAILSELPDLRKVNLVLEDIEGKKFSSRTLGPYHYAIHRYSERAAIQGTVEGKEVTVVIASIDQFASRVRKAISP